MSATVSAAAHPARGRAARHAGCRARARGGDCRVHGRHDSALQAGKALVRCRGRLPARARRLSRRRLHPRAAETAEPDRLVDGARGILRQPDVVAGPYAVAAYRLHDHLPLPQVAVFLQPSWAPTIFLFTLAVMLFPDGTLPSGRWRWAMGTLAAAGAVWMIGAFVIAAEAIVTNQVVIEPSGDLKQIDYPSRGWAWWSVAQDRLVPAVLLRRRGLARQSRAGLPCGDRRAAPAAQVADLRRLGAVVGGVLTVCSRASRASSASSAASRSSACSGSRSRSASA